MKIQSEKTEIEDILSDLTASLSAAISLLKKSKQKSTTADRLFDLMIEDYEKTLGKSRALINRLQIGLLL